MKLLSPLYSNIVELNVDKRSEYEVTVFNYDSDTLQKIRDAYKSIALETHPDAGGSTDEMRKLNEAYQLLKNLYRK